MEEKTVDTLLEELEKIVKTLKASLPKEAPLFISKSIDPVRALHLREACMHRVTELAEAAYSNFKNENLVAAYLLARAILETIALFWYFVDEVREALKSNDIDKLRLVLTRMMVGAKVVMARESIAEAVGKTVKEMGKSLDPIHVMDLIRHVSKQLPPFEDHYNFLCEVSHPNATGLIRAYVKNDWDKGMSYFGKEHGSFGSHVSMDLQALILCLEGFADLYDESALVLADFCSLLEH